MGNLSVFHGAPTSDDGQAVPSGIASLGIDVTSGQIYYKNPQDKSQPGWRLNTVGGSSGPFVQLSPTSDQTIVGAGIAGQGGTIFDISSIFGSGAVVEIGRPNSDPNADALEIHTIYANGESIYTHSNTGFRSPYFVLARSRGTRSVPTAVLLNDPLGTVQYQGYDGTGYAVGGYLNFGTTENWDSGHHGAILNIGATFTGSTSGGNVAAFGEKIGTDGRSLSAFYNVALSSNVVLEWNSTTSGGGTADTGLSRLGPASLALGNATASDVSGKLTLGNEVLTAAAPTVSSGQVGLGGTTAATATAGGGQAALATVLGYLVANVGGTTVKIPYFAA